MRIFLFFLLLLSIGPAISAGDESTEFVDLGKFTSHSINLIIGESNKYSENNSIEIISEKFLNVPYLGFTLIGSENKQEVLTINLGGMDCFTYIDYVEAIRQATDYNSFKIQLKKIRYKDGIVDYRARNHFFSDWPLYNSANVIDVTQEIGGVDTNSASKNLNLKNDGSKFLPGIPVVERNITYIPSAKLSADDINKMNTGDYIGIYSDIDGLDVSHTGILIKKNGKAYIRHASSGKNKKKVVDEDLIIYMKNKPGIVIFRPI